MSFRTIARSRDHFFQYLAGSKRSVRIPLCEDIHQGTTLVRSTHSQRVQTPICAAAESMAWVTASVPRKLV